MTGRSVYSLIPEPKRSQISSCLRARYRVSLAEAIETVIRCLIGEELSDRDMYVIKAVFSCLRETVGTDGVKTFCNRAREEKCLGE